MTVRKRRPHLYTSAEDFQVTMPITRSHCQAPNDRNVSNLALSMATILQLSPNAQRPHARIFTVSPCGSDDEKFGSSHSLNRVDYGRAPSREAHKSRNSSRHSSTSRQSSRNSSGSSYEMGGQVKNSEVLNTATIHSSFPSTSNEVPIYAKSSSLAQNSRSSVTALQELFSQTQVCQPSSLQTYSHFFGLVDNKMVFNYGPGTYSLHIQEGQEHLETKLESVLHSNGCFATGVEKRKEIVRSLNELVRQWIRSLTHGYPAIHEVEGAVLTYGSCKLQAADAEADMDLICVAPNFVKREDFFDSFFKVLQKTSEVSELRQLSEAYVPVIKFSYENIEVDLTFARLNCPHVPRDEHELLDERYTRDLDDKCVKSLNGYRATCELLTLVPDVRVFQTSLRAIKLWAKKNGIYSNILGYLGGASWAILVAKACQKAPEAYGVEWRSAAEVVFFFFQLFSAWPWPDPVYIRYSSNQPSTAWNPRVNFYDREHAMPIITSSVPQMNSAVNVSLTNRALIVKKLQEGHSICQDIKAGTASWDKLFQVAPFFQEFSDYIIITGSCQRESSFWFGLIESKLRRLKDKIETDCRVSTVRIWPKGYLKQDPTSIQQLWFIGLGGFTANLQHAVLDTLKHFQSLCSPETGRRHNRAYNRDMESSVSYAIVKQAELERFLPPEVIGEINRDTKLSYAAVTQGTSSSGREVSPPMTCPPSSLSTLVVTASTPPPSVTTTVAPLLAPYSYLHPPYTQHRLLQHHLQQPVVHPVYPADRSSPPVGHALRRSGSSPLGFPRSGNNSPQSLRRQVASPHLYQPEGSLYAAPAAYLHSPDANYGSHSAPHSPLSESAASLIAPMFPHFTVPPPALPRHMGTTPPPPPGLHRLPTQQLPPPVQLPSVAVAVSSHRRSNNYTQLSGINHINTVNNNLGRKDWCPSVSDSEASIPAPPTRQESTSDGEDRLRSVSNSSDTVAPKVLFRSRMAHQDAPPPSPFTIPPLSSPPSSFLSGLVPLDQADITVPPPRPMSRAATPTVQEGPLFTFSSLQSSEMGIRARPHRSPRHSVSEIVDVSSPRPIHPINHRGGIKFNITQNNDDVFR